MRAKPLLGSAPMKTHNPATPAKVATLLSALGYKVIEEHPGYVSVALPYGVTLAVGTANGPWEIDMEHKGSIASTGMSLPAEGNPDAGTVAQWVADYARDISRRFVWALGAYVEAYPDMPANLPTCLWDRQEGKPVITLSDDYGQLICLEHTNAPDRAPFTALEDWLNSINNTALASEGIIETRNA